MLIASRKIWRDEACRHLQIGRKSAPKPIFPINEYTGAACMPKGSEFVEDFQVVILGRIFPTVQRDNWVPLHVWIKSRAA